LKGNPTLHRRKKRKKGRRRNPPSPLVLGSDNPRGRKGKRGKGKRGTLSASCSHFQTLGILSRPIGRGRGEKRGRIVFSYLTGHGAGRGRRRNRFCSVRFGRRGCAEEKKRGETAGAVGINLHPLSYPLSGIRPFDDGERKKEREKKGKKRSGRITDGIFEGGDYCHSAPARRRRGEGEKKKKGEHR